MSLRQRLLLYVLLAYCFGSIQLILVLVSYGIYAQTSQSQHAMAFLLLPVSSPPLICLSFWLYGSSGKEIIKMWFRCVFVALIMVHTVFDVRELEARVLHFKA